MIRTKWKVYFLSTVKEANRKDKIYYFSLPDQICLIKGIKCKFLIKFFGGTLVHKAIQVWSAQLNSTSSAHCTVCPSPQEVSFLPHPYPFAHLPYPCPLSLRLSPHCSLCLCGRYICFFGLIPSPSII